MCPVFVKKSFRFTIIFMQLYSNISCHPNLCFLPKCNVIEKM